MKTKLILPAVQNSGTPLNVEARPNAALAMPASSDVSEVDAKSVCATARFGPFGPFRFRISVKPGRSPRFKCRVLRKDGVAGYFRALNHA